MFVFKGENNRNTCAHQRRDAPLPLFATHRDVPPHFLPVAIFTKIEDGAAGARAVAPRLLGGLNRRRTSAQGLCDEEHVVQTPRKAERFWECDGTFTDHAGSLPPSRGAADGHVPLPDVAVSVVAPVKGPGAHPGALVPQRPGMREGRRGAAVDL